MSVTLERVSQDIPAARARWKPSLKLTWEHAGLGAILMLAGFLGLWNLTVNNYSNSYYASAVRSMLQSWHNFFFASFDPGGFVSVDKPPVAFWVQTAFAKVFGFSGVSLLLPEALAGIGGVFLLYVMVKKAWGTAAGLLSALMLAITPIWVVMNRDNNPDSLLVFTLLLAAWALFRAAEKGRLRWLMVASVLVGVAFNIKMMEAYVVLPAFYAMYFFAARTGWRKRILHLTLATVVIAVVSLSWAVAVDLTPASQRPYVGSSTANSELDLILNYNGLGRVDGTENGGGGTGTRLTDGTGATTSQTNGGTTTAAATTTSGTTTGLPSGSGFTPPSGGQQGGPSGGGFGGQSGATRLIIPSLAGEFNWFMPLALLGTLYLGLYAFRMAKGEERSRRLQSVILWGGWWVVYGLVFSFSKGIFHNYYLIIMAPAQAALAGVTLVMLWKRYRQGGWQAYLLPAALVATALYQAYILTGYTSWNWWLGPVLIVAGLVGAIGLIIARRWRYERFGRGLALGIVGTTTAFLLATPLAWSVRAVFTSMNGSIVSAEPGSQGGGGFGGNSSTSSDGIQTWLNFIGQNLGGELVILAALAIAVVMVIGAARLLHGRRLLNAPVVAGILLALFLVGSTGWWVNAAQAKTTTTSASSAMQGGFGGGPGGDQTNSSLISYLEANQGDYAYLVAVSSSQSADSIIIETGKPVMALGGFSGSDKIITSTAQLQQLIANHTIRYFLISGQGGGPGGSSSVVSQYVQQSCTVVSSSAYSSTTTASSTATASTEAITTDGRSFGGSQTLYVCGS